MLVGYLKSVLDAEGIGCTVRNELLGGGAGELPPNECWPELWVLHNVDAARAVAVIEFALAEHDPTETPWQCPHCREHSEPQFGACWSCGALRPNLPADAG